MTSSYIPDRGDLIWLTFDPQVGHEQAGRRPAIVLSLKRYNQSSRLALVCPITRKAKGYPFELPLPLGSTISGLILVDQIKSSDWLGRNASFIGRAPLTLIDEILARVRPILGS